VSLAAFRVHLAVSGEQGLSVLFRASTKAQALSMAVRLHPDCKVVAVERVPPEELEEEA
jgi:hypothetical protein